MLYFLHKMIHNSSAVDALEHRIMLGARSVTTATFTVSSVDAIVNLNLTKNKTPPADKTQPHIDIRIVILLSMPNNISILAAFVIH